MPRLIDADALKEYITKAYEEMKSEFKTDKYRDIAKLVTESFCMDIDEAPTIDPVKRGHWEDVKVSDDGKLQSAKCSVCGRYETKPYMYYLRLSNYCSWCGAKNVSDTDVGKKEEEE